MRTVGTIPDHEALHRDLIALIERQGDALSGEEMLAVAAHVVGQLLVFAALDTGQITRRITRRKAWGIINRNIAAGHNMGMCELRRRSLH